MTSNSYSHTVLPIIRRVRGMLLPHYGRVEFREKPGRTQEVVTDLDVVVERFYKEEFSKLYPDIPFVGEESGGDRNTSRFWLVDPIDGTSHFVRGLPFCTSQLALIENGQIVFSVVYDFVDDMLYHAERGCGAFANEHAMRVSGRLLDGSRLATVFNLRNEEAYRSYLKLQEHCHTFQVGASGYELAQVASGKLDGAVYYGQAGSRDYDVAPGAFLIKEAGGTVANIGSPAQVRHRRIGSGSPAQVLQGKICSGSPAQVLQGKICSGSRGYDYRNLNFIAANPLVFKELTEGPDAIFPIQ